MFGNQNNVNVSCDVTIECIYEVEIVGMMYIGLDMVSVLI